MRRGFLTQYKTKKSKHLSANLGDDAYTSSEDDVMQLTSQSNMDTLMVERFFTSRHLRAQTQKLTFHDIEFDNFRGSMLLDESVLRLLSTKPFGPPHRSYPSPFEISMTTVKGLGMFATRDIAAKEIIYSENPTVVVYPFIILSFDMTKSELYRALFDRLDPPVRDQLLALKNCEPSTACNVEEGIVRSNGFAITLPVPATDHALESLHSGVFLDISRCNHRCSYTTHVNGTIIDIAILAATQMHFTNGIFLASPFFSPRVVPFVQEKK
jgi:hypothetical protein